MENKGKRYPELDLFNAAACLLVILIHVLSLGIGKLLPDSVQMICIYFPWKLAAFVVPAFLFCSAVKVGMTANQPDFRFGRYLSGRFRRIYVPYLIANAVYYAFFSLIHYVKPSASDFVFQTLLGTLSSPFYYVVILMQFYLLVPLWRWAVRKIPAGIGLFSALFLTILAAKADAVCGLFGGSFPYADRFFLTYLFWWVLGLYAGASYNAAADSLHRRSPALYLCGGFCVFFALLCYLQFAHQVYLYDLNLLRLFSDTFAILVLWKGCLALTRSPRLPHMKRGLLAVHRASFFVYLYHCLVMECGMQVFGRLGISDIGALLVLRMVVTYSVPFGVFFLWELIRNRCGRFSGRKKI